MCFIIRKEWNSNSNVWKSDLWKCIENIILLADPAQIVLLNIKLLLQNRGWHVKGWQIRVVSIFKYCKYHEKEKIV